MWGEVSPSPLAHWCIFVFYSFICNQMQRKIGYHAVLLATDGNTDTKMSSFYQFCKLMPIQSVSSNTTRNGFTARCLIGLKSFYNYKLQTL